MDLGYARAAYDARRWAHAFELYQARATSTLPTWTATPSPPMLGRRDDYFAIRERAYEHCLAAGDLVGAAEAALWVACRLMNGAGEDRAGSGWLARATRLVRQDGTDSAAAAYLGVAQALSKAVAGGLDEAAMATTSAAVEDCPTPRARLPGGVGHEEGLFLGAGRLDEGMAKADEAVLTLLAGRHPDGLGGIAYCGTISGCWSVFDLRRAHEWTAAMSAWCDAQPELGVSSSSARCGAPKPRQHSRGAWADAREELAGVSAQDGDAWAAGAAATCAAPSTGSRGGSTTPPTPSVSPSGWARIRSRASPSSGWPRGACRRPRR